MNSITYTDRSCLERDLNSIECTRPRVAVSPELTALANVVRSPKPQYDGEYDGPEWDAYCKAINKRERDIKRAAPSLRGIARSAVVSAISDGIPLEVLVTKSDRFWRAYTGPITAVAIEAWMQGAT